MQSPLEFELRLQQYIELIRTRQCSKIAEATAHARKYLASHADAQRAVQASALLAYAPDTRIETYRVSRAPPLLHYTDPHD